MKTKKLVALVLVVLMLCAVFAGCAKEAAPASSETGTGTEKPANVTEPAASGEPISVIWWCTWAADQPRGAILREAAAAFNAENPGIVVEVEHSGNYEDTANKIEAAVVAKSTPALAVVEETFVGRFNPVAADISKYISPETLDNYVDGLLKSCYVDGVLKSVPFNRSTTILYMNKTLFEQAGLPVEGPKTWDELEQYANTIAAMGDDLYGYALYWDTDGWFWESAIYSWGEEIFNEDYTELLFNTEDSLKMIDMAQRMADSGVMVNPYVTQGTYEDIALEPFMSGKVGMLMDSIANFTNHATALEEVGMEVALAFQPMGTEHSMTTGGGSIIMFDGISEEQKVAAGKFLEFLASDDFSSRFCELTGYLPVTETSMETDLVKEILTKYPTYQVMFDQLQYAHGRPLTPNWRGVYNILTEELEACLQDTSLEPKVAIQNAYDRSMEFLKKSQ